MPTFLLNLLGSPKALGIILIVVLAGYGTYKYKDMVHTIETQKIEISNEKEKRRKAEKESEALQRSTEELQRRIEEARKVEEDIQEIEDEVNEASEEEDGEVAPVLRSVLDALNRLLEDNQNRDTGGQS